MEKTVLYLLLEMCLMKHLKVILTRNVHLLNTELVMSFKHTMNIQYIHPRKDREQSSCQE